MKTVVVMTIAWIFYYTKVFHMTFRKTKGYRISLLQEPIGIGVIIQMILNNSSSVQTSVGSTFGSFGSNLQVLKQ